MSFSSDSQGDDAKQASVASPVEQNRPAGKASRFTWFQQIEFISKELRETLRDRRTIVTLLAMPLLLYPLIGLGFRFFALQQVAATASVFRLALETEEEARYVMDLIELSESVKRNQQEQASLAQTAAPSSQSDASNPLDRSIAIPTGPPKIEILVPKDLSEFNLDQSVETGVADLGVRAKMTAPTREKPWVSGRVEIIENSASALSQNAAAYLEKSFARSNLELVRAWARSRDPNFELPVEQSKTKLNAGSSQSAVLGLFPLILLLMTVTGGVYPSIDLTAGERERNTLETLISLPVPKFRLLFAKFCAVVTVTMMTGLINLVAMSVTLYALQLDVALLGPSGLTLSLGLKLLLALTAFALFYSAVLLLITSSARSFKEAQAYLIPLLLLSIGPGMVILMPGWSLGRGTAVIPLVNILLLTKEFLEGTASFVPALVAIVSTLLYGVAALAIASQIFGTDAVAVGSRGRWRDLISRPEEPQRSASIALALVGLAILFPAYFVASGALSRDSNAAHTERLIWSGGLTIALFAGLPCLLLLWHRVKLSDGLALFRTSWMYWIGAVLIGLSAWPFIFEIVVWSHNIGLRGLDPAKMEIVEKLLEGWKQVPLPLIILALGIIPGVCEEVFFRGFLFGGLREYVSGKGTILATAILFGLFHLVLAGGAAPERLLPSTIMGLILGWVRWKSGSLIPGILLHATHNSLLLGIAKNRDELEGWGLGAIHEVHLPGTWLAAAAFVLILGVGLVFVAKSRDPAADETDRKG
jgi:ABC-2 type transport system permease protein/sodium transport system permease protein